MQTKNTEVQRDLVQLNMELLKSKKATNMASVALLSILTPDHTEYKQGSMSTLTKLAETWKIRQLCS
jgi:hypothetical protein